MTREERNNIERRELRRKATIAFLLLFVVFQLLSLLVLGGGRGTGNALFWQVASGACLGIGYYGIYRDAKRK